MKTTSYEIAPNLYLVNHPIPSGGTKTVTEQETNHVIVVDCSGSMMGELPLIRKHLINKLPKLVKDGDTVSLIWFSGRGEFGVLVEAEKVEGLRDLKTMETVINRWLKPVGLTGFKEPLAEVAALIKRCKNKNPWSLFFMSDGCDNQWDRASILKTVEATADKLASSTFVEYGYYADRALLSAMAQKAGGVHIFAETFPKFEPVIEAAVQKRTFGAKRVEVKVKGDPIGGFVFAIDPVAKELQTFEVTGNDTAVPETTESVWYLSPSKVGAVASWQKGATADADSAAYAAMSLFAVRMKPDVVFPLLKATGDVFFIKAFSSCFGKQKYSEFMQTAQRAAFDPTVRLTQGYNPDLVPRDDAFTVLDLLNVLANDEDARVLLDHPMFEYNRIGRAQLDADEYLTVDEQEKLEELQNEMAATRAAKKLKEIQAKIDEILAKKRPALKFKATPIPEGVAISSLTFNEATPNVSILIKREGTVDISARLAECKDAKITGAVGTALPSDFPTHIHRNYAIIKDGLVNVGKLPVKLTRATYEVLRKADVPLASAGTDDDETFIIDVMALPIINRKMVNSSQSAKALIEMEYRLTEARAAQKVYNSAQKEAAPVERSAGLKVKYGEEAAAWLKEQGITDGGFSPKKTVAESKDFYIAREMDVKLKGLASLPKVEDVRGGKVTGGGGLMAPFVKEVDDFMKKNPAKLHKDFLQGKAKAQRAIARGLSFQRAQIVFGTIVGQVWFKEFGTLEENTLDVTIDGKTITGTIALREVEVAI